MKKGDILIAKKAYYDLLKHKNTINIGQNYTIYNISNDVIELFDDIHESIIFYNVNTTTFRYIYDYFYTKQELRQLKLESL